MHSFPALTNGSIPRRLAEASLHGRLVHFHGDIHLYVNYHPLLFRPFAAPPPPAPGPVPVGVRVIIHFINDVTYCYAAGLSDEMVAPVAVRSD